MSTVTHAVHTDPGLTHPANEDRWLARPPWGLYVITDGMANAKAPEMVVELLPDTWQKRLRNVTDLTDASVAEKVREALAEVSEEIRAAGGLGGLGATVVLAWVRGDKALIAHLGDSRAYLLRGGRLEPLTRDHSLLEEWVERGKLSRAMATFAQSNGGPTRFAGMGGEPEADVRLLDLQPGDRILLCSDGLNCMLPDEQIEAIFNQYPPPAEACRRLVDAANAAGGKDNVTALVIAVSSP